MPTEYSHKAVKNQFKRDRIATAWQALAIYSINFFLLNISLSEPSFLCLFTGTVEPRRYVKSTNDAFIIIYLSGTAEQTGKLL